jgi:2-oxoglutarate dehydrogenase E2 component (dihydrolipoamide succinyltransferase)
MAKIELLLPAMGEGIIEATITRWLVKEGDQVEEDQPLLEIATDKVDSEIPSPVKGVITKIVMNEGEVPAVGNLLAEIEIKGEAGDTGRDEVMKEVGRITGKTAAMTAQQPGSQNREESDSQNREKTETPGSGLKEELQTGREISEKIQPTAGFPRQTPSGKFMTPLVRSIAKAENISPGDLDSIQGSGEGGRITREDLMTWLNKKGKEKTDDDLPGVTLERQVSAPAEGDRRIEMDRIRKLIASRMVTSKQTSPHVTSFIDADVTDMVKWREANKNEFLKRENQKITYTPVFIEAASKALRDYPMVNISVDGTAIIIKKNINIGMAVALPGGNLIVPVIKNADEKSLTGLVKAVNDLARRARDNKLQSHEIAGGTFTITNFGTFRNTTGTPIINQPEAAILGTGAIIKKPVVLETENGDVIAIRHIMTLSLSYDHRVIDGALGGMFLKRLAERLENFDPGRKI